MLRPSAFKVPSLEMTIDSVAPNSHWRFHTEDLAKSVRFTHERFCKRAVGMGCNWCKCMKNKNKSLLVRQLASLSAFQSKSFFVLLFFFFFLFSPTDMTVKGFSRKWANGPFSIKSLSLRLCICLSVLLVSDILAVIKYAQSFLR